MVKRNSNIRFDKCKIAEQCKVPGCENYAQKRDIIQKIIDGQATEEEQELYNEIIAKCNDCQCKEYCDQEMAIKNLIQTKIDRKKVPLDILENIKTNIGKTADK